MRTALVVLMVRQRSSSKPAVPAKIRAGKKIRPNSMPIHQKMAMITKSASILNSADTPYIPRILIFMDAFLNKGTDWIGAVISPAP